MRIKNCALFSFLFSLTIVACDVTSGRLTNSEMESNYTMQLAIQ